MADIRRIEGLRKIYKESSRDDLIVIKHSKVPHCEEHIAAVQELDARDQAVRNPQENKIMPQTKTWDLDVFISHSGKDKEVAQALVELITMAVSVPHDRIRCTSVDGYRLPGGAATDDQLKREVRQSAFFIALLTPRSLRSPYVLFELGARWGAELHFVPLLACGSTASDLNSPLSTLNALSCDSASQVHQLVKEIGESLSKPTNQPAIYERYLQHLLDVSATDAEISEVQPGQPTSQQQPTTQGGRELLALIQSETNPEERGLVELDTDSIPGMTLYFPKIQYGGQPLPMKARLFRQGVSELVELDWLYPPEENPSHGARTYDYRPE